MKFVTDMSEYVEDSLELLALLLRDLSLGVSVLISIDVVVKDLLNRDVTIFTQSSDCT